MGQSLLLCLLLFDFPDFVGTFAIFFFDLRFFFLLVVAFCSFCFSGSRFSGRVSLLESTLARRCIFVPNGLVCR